MTQNTAEQFWHDAIALHKTGRLADAEARCRQLLAQRPNHAEATHLLGIIAMQTGRPSDAAAFFKQAIAIRPNYAQALANLGNALSASGAHDEAIVAYRQALAINSQMAEAHFALANALAAKRSPAEAITEYRHAISLKPDYAKAYYNLGIFLRDAGDLDSAILALRRAAELKPSPEYFANLGVALHTAKKLDDAAAAFKQAIALNPKIALVHCNLGVVLLEQGNVDEAAQIIRHAVALDPNLPEAHNNLATALSAQCKLDDAIIELRKAAALSPNDPVLASNLLFMLPFSPAYDPAKILEEASAWNRRFAEALAKEIAPHLNDRSPNRRLRIGYVSPDFWNHCQALFMEPLLAHHDHQAFEIFCYADVKRPDAVTERLKKLPDVWLSTVGQSDSQVAAQIRTDKIDILIDLTMHMANNRALLFARKPAPVQACYLAYPGTTGIKAIDYRISDRYLDPDGRDESLYAEKTIRLPDTFWCYEPAEGRDIPLRPLPALSNGFVRFACLSNIFKMGGAVLQLWSRVLAEVPKSKLLLRAAEGSTRNDMLQVFQAQQIDPARIEFVPGQSRRKYLEEYNRIDIGLDCFPYNGHTTSLDSFWMGVPVVTKVGSAAHDRAGYCQLMNLNLPELAADSAEGFVRIARDLAADLPRLAAIRSSLRERMQSSPLMDAPRFTRNIESAYRTMWLAWCERKA